MKITRLILGLWLAAALTGCTLAPGLFPPELPDETVTPGPTPTPTPSPIPSPTATPLPIVRVEKGEAAFFNGDYETALLHYTAAFKDSSEAMTRAAALWGEGRVYYEQKRYPEAIDVFQQIITSYPESPFLADAYFLQGMAYDQLERYPEAAAAWQTYLTLKPNVIDAYVQEQRGDALFAAGNYTDALAAYTAAIQAPRRDDGILVDMKVAQTRAGLGDYQQAQALYDGILARATNDYVKAQAAYLSGAAYQAEGRMEEAFAKFRLAVENYPLSYYAYLSLVELVNAGAQVSNLDRGIVDYYAGQYAKAYEVLDQYMLENPADDGTAAYYRALSLRELGNYEQAVDAFTYFINNYPSHPNWSEAWDDKAFIQWAYLRQDVVGAQTYLDFVYGVPNSPFAPDYLMSAARAFERAGRLDDAAKTWQRVANEYPGNDQSPTAIFLAGIVYYRQGNFNDALQNFNRSLALAGKKEDQARAYLWVGKAQQKLGDAEATRVAWQQGQITDPGGYYSERCRDLLTGAAPFDKPLLVKLSFDPVSERADADAWVRLTFNLPAETNLNDPGTLAADPRWIRGTELWNLGLYDEARLEFEDLREAVSANAVDSYKLANYLIDLGLYRTAIFAARQTLTLAGLDEHTESMMAPIYFSRVRYGLYYSDLILPAAQEEGLDPLLLFSVVRQESLFEGFIRSTAGARGLMQIIPQTGASVAAEYGWPLNFTPDDLYRPIVSIKLGAHYLANNRRLLGNSDYAALAAYNAGPGNAVAWREIGGDDPDLFLETVRFEETRQYIRNIYEIYIIYKRLYSPAAQ